MANPQGTNYTNLQKIIEANKNNQLGSTIQSGVNKGIAGLQSGVNEAQNQFQTDVNNANQNTEGNQQYTQNTINSIVNPNAANSSAPQGQVPSPQVSSSSSAPQQNNQMQPAITHASSPLSSFASTLKTESTQQTPQPSSAPAAPSNAAPGSFGSVSTSGTNQTPNTFNQSGADVQKFNQLLQGGYLGPNQLKNYNTLLAQGQNLQAQGQNLNTTGGLQNLLQQYIGGNNYTKGEQGLDTLLLGQTAKPQLQDIARNLKNVINIPQSAETQAEGLAQQTATGNREFAQNLKNQLTAAQNPILQDIQGNLGTLNQKNQQFQGVGQQVYDLLNKANTGSSFNKIGGGGAAPVTDVQAVGKALDLAVKNGIADPDTVKQIITKLRYAPAEGANDAKQLLSQAYSFDPTLPQYTLQQGANAQQAAQLNALAQLGGNQQQFSTYGGANPLTASFDPNKLPIITAPSTPEARSSAKFGDDFASVPSDILQMVGLFAGATWFCTELFTRRLIGFNDLFEMSKFFFPACIKRTNMVLFYIKNGPEIVKAANKHNFNWIELKHKIIDNIISLRNQGKPDEANEAYTLIIKDMCLKFKETEHLWDDKYLKTSIKDIVLNIIPLIKTKTFRKNVLVYIAGIKDKLFGEYNEPVVQLL